MVSGDFDPSSVLTVSPDGKTVTMLVEDLKLLWAEHKAVTAERDALREALSTERSGADRLVETSTRLEALTLQLNEELKKERARRKVLGNERWLFLLGGIVLGAATL